MKYTDPEFKRNLGFISADEQDILINSSVAIAGAGGDGGMLAIQLARLGVGSLKLADPDSFERENINRQACATTETVDVNKAEAVGKYIKLLNPGIKVDIFEEGITERNIEEFVHGSDLVIDETEFTMHVLGVMIAREARRQNVPNLMAMNIGFGATVTSFIPTGRTFEETLGLADSASLQSIAGKEVPLSKWLPYVPPYVDIDMLADVAAGRVSAPTVTQGVAAAASAGSTEAMLHLLKDQNNRPSPIIAPEVLVFDAYSRIVKIVPHTDTSHQEHMAAVIEYNTQGLVPKVG